MFELQQSSDRVCISWPGKSAQTQQETARYGAVGKTTEVGGCGTKLREGH